ncbi:hypothetical protein C8N43_2322 [Litoreibacter ponti]|uniref:Uncharacterized protein n=1 Tax=Litoreibacter ponti TaxID=1510457 RepID=A0A2T6BNK4_9RHOB|nr:hypothetical protein [Litoreibacter ponti]PTX57651.1 hypothetical protein C8N43_2322 [Litoreibacter ponti]
MLQVAFILLCLAQIIHLSRHWYALDMRLREDARSAKLRHAVDWTAQPVREREPHGRLFDKVKEHF